MKKLLLSAAALALTAGAALAADLPSRKGPPVLPPPPPPPPMWTGYYVGMNAGYGFGTNSSSQTGTWGQPINFVANPTTTTPAPFVNSTTLGSGLALSGVSSMTQDGFIGGGQIGYNYQWGQNFLVGIEVDMQGTGIRGSGSNRGLGGDSAFNVTGTAPRFFDTTTQGITSVRAGVDWMGTVRGRIGYLWTPTMLVYATGGLTYGGVWANVNQAAMASTLNTATGGTFTHTFIGGANASSTLVGWNVGGGLEWMFMPNWSLKGEAFYWNMGNMRVNHIAVAAAPMPSAGAATVIGDPAMAVGATSVNYSGVVARAGVNYHFNFGSSAPMLSKF